MSQISIKERTDRMIAKDAILLNTYTCKGRNYSCECKDCIFLCKSIKKKIDWKTLIHINGNIKGGKNFIRTELPKISNDKKLITKSKKQEEELLSIKKEKMLKSAEEERKKEKKRQINKEYLRKYQEWYKRRLEEKERKSKPFDYKDAYKDPKFIALAKYHSDKVAVERRVEELTKGLPHKPLDIRCYFTPIGEKGVGEGGIRIYN